MISVITINNLSESAHSELFDFLYRNKCIGSSADNSDGTYTVSVHKGIEKVEFFKDQLTLIADTGDYLVLASFEFYKAEIM